MATPSIVTIRDFTKSRYGQLADAGDGVDVGGIIARAEAIVQSIIGDRLVSTTYTEVKRPTTNDIYTCHRPIISVASVRRRLSRISSWETMASSDYDISSKEGVILAARTVAGYDVEIVYTAGYVSVPEDIKEAILMQSALLMYQDLEMYTPGDAKPPGILYNEQMIEEILCRHKRSVFVPC